jgi:5,6-dimethylbenzimidazole synthase
MHPQSQTIAPPDFDEEFRDDLRRLFAWRRDVRRFERVPLPEATVERLIATACMSPSVGLSQPWRFIVVNDPVCRAEVKASFERCNRDALEAQNPDKAALYAQLKLAGLDEAPCQIAVFADHATLQGGGLGRLTMPETIDYSAAIAIHTLWLAARAEGLGVGWVSILDPERVAKALGVPQTWSFIGYLCVGYPQTQDDTPLLEQAGWEFRRPPAGTIFYR